MAELAITNLNKSYDQLRVVRDVNLHIRDKEFVVLVGPSGCGKSTILRMIAGLEEITSGEIRIGDRVVNDLAPKDRDIAMVFQNYALYPHMSVRENMAFGLRRRRISKGDIKIQVDAAADALGIKGLLHRKPRQLSGGQRQRVALGRAIVRNPQVFLFDEPLSNLDAQLRVQMRLELKRLHQRLQATIIYVTHDQIEAMTLGDRVVVMRDGLVQQIDEPMELYTKPANRFVASFIGSPAMNFMDAVITVQEGGPWISCQELSIRAAEDMHAKLRPYVGRHVTLGVRPEDIHLSIAETSSQYPFKGIVDIVEPLGSEIVLGIFIGGNSLVARVDPKLRVKAGDSVSLKIDADRLHLFDLDSEKVL